MSHLLSCIQSDGLPALWWYAYQGGANGLWTESEEGCGTAESASGTSRGGDTWPGTDTDVSTDTDTDTDTDTITDRDTDVDTDTIQIQLQVQVQIQVRIQVWQKLRVYQRHKRSRGMSAHRLWGALPVLSSKGGANIIVTHLHELAHVYVGLMYVLIYVYTSMYMYIFVYMFVYGLV